VKLIVLPEDGLRPVVAAIRQAKSSVDLTIFRFDRPEVEKALGAAVERGVRVRALIAHTNHGGERRLRKLEQRLLGAGVTVARSADDLARYHGKILIVDNRTLHLMLFNLTALDARSRSFALVTGDREVVADAVRLFEADASRQRFQPSTGHLVISPETARAQLTAFIGQANRELLLYDPKISDPAMVRLLEDRARGGVDVRIIGSVGKRARALSAMRLSGPRLHARVAIRDGRHAFLGSQSLRAVELDGRREIGVIISDRRLVRSLRDCFDRDWRSTRAATQPGAHVPVHEADVLAEPASP
jgi:phosphatidylserine/phosphatidylglycerophosphate/cardiolipin synthase-like enzyme